MSNSNSEFYSYSMMKSDFEDFKKSFPDAETGVFGHSVWGRPLEYIKIGAGRHKMLFCGAHHGMEHLTSKLLLKFAYEYQKAILGKSKIGSECAKRLSLNTSLYIVPMLNPDGVDLSVYGLKAPDIKNAEYLKYINPKEDFSDWQANAHGVDLNHNYNAKWELSKESEKKHGIFGAGKTRFSGTAPESEPESYALCRFTEARDFDLVIAFHSQGKVIYYNFFDKEPIYSLAIAKAFEDISCYKVDYTDGIASFGGYKDWFIDRFLRPGFTVEIGDGKNPLPLSDLEKVYEETLPLMVCALSLKL